MSQKAKLDTTCPNNHNLTVTFTRENFERVLKTDSLMLHCNTCNAKWPPSHTEIEKLRKELGLNG